MREWKGKQGERAMCVTQNVWQRGSSPVVCSSRVCTSFALRIARPLASPRVDFSFRAASDALNWRQRQREEHGGQAAFEREVQREHVDELVVLDVEALGDGYVVDVLMEAGAEVLVEAREGVEKVVGGDQVVEEEVDEDLLEGKVASVGVGGAG